jgi:hypothetical protein
MPQLTDQESEMVAQKAAEKLLTTDDWALEEKGYNPQLSPASPDVILPSGRRLSVKITVEVFDHHLQP